MYSVRSMAGNKSGRCVLSEVLLAEISSIIFPRIKILHCHKMIVSQ